MTAKRFENRLNKDNIKFHTLNPVWDNEKEDALNVFEMMKCLNALHEENRALQRHLDVMRSGALTDDKRIKELYDENEQLKLRIKELEIENQGQSDAIDGLQEFMAHYDLEDYE